MFGKIFGSFDEFITPAIAKILFYIGVVFSVLGGLSLIVSILSIPYIGGISKILGMLGGVLVALVGIILSRVSSELLIVTFCIADDLKEIRRNQSIR